MSTGLAYVTMSFHHAIFYQDILWLVLYNHIFGSVPWAFRKHEISTALQKTHFDSRFDFQTLMSYLFSGCFEFVLHHIQTDFEAKLQKLDNRIPSQQRNLYVLKLKTYQIYQDFGNGQYFPVSLEDYLSIYSQIYPHRNEPLLGYFAMNFQPMIREDCILPGYAIISSPVTVNHIPPVSSGTQLHKDEPTPFVLVVLDNSYPPLLKSIRPISIPDVEKMQFFEKVSASKGCIDYSENYMQFHCFNFC